MLKSDVIIIGASASGMMCAIEAGKRGRSVIILDHAAKAGNKIRMSGGGRCNFTNYDVSADNYISHNPHFCKSALSRYSQWDFIALVDKYQIPYHERSHGQLFCNDSSKDILEMLLAECRNANVTISLKTNILNISKPDENKFVINTHSDICDKEAEQQYHSNSLVIATGGLSIPTMGATAFGYQTAKQFGLNVLPTHAGLVPFTLQPDDKQHLSELSGIAVESIVCSNQNSFRENILFTHRGLSGPAILQISSYWLTGETLTINLLPDLDLLNELKRIKKQKSKLQLKTLLGKYLPKRLINMFLEEKMSNATLQDISNEQLDKICLTFQRWQIKPNGTEGYRTAEVTLGGVDCNELSSKTMESEKVPGLYFIGEVMDVTGWLGGYNFQWAWSSGWCAGQYV